MQGFNRLRQLDAFPKINEDFYSRTLSGGVITIVSSVIMLALFITELSTYFLSLHVFNLLCYRSLLLDGETWTMFVTLELSMSQIIFCDFK